MAKRHGNLWEQVISEDNIRLAYVRAKKGKGKKRSVKKFAKNADFYLKQIRESLVNKTFTTGTYGTKTVYEPKKRTIYILPFCPDRIVQHAVMNIIVPIWNKILISESYACRPEKGMHKGSLKTMEYIRHNKYCLKCDISKFYPSINHAIMKKVIRRKIKDPNVLWLLDDIIDSFEGETNTPIGNYTSQWFGNMYLNELDEYVKQELGFKCYIRYCDDFLFFHNDKAVLHDIAKKIETFCRDKLQLKLSKCDLFPVSRGVDFLGYRHFPKYILLRKSTAKRAKRRIKSILRRLYKHKITAGQFRSTVASYIGWTQWANTYNLRLKLHLDLLKGVSRYAKTADDIIGRLSGVL